MGIHQESSLRTIMTERKAVIKNADMSEDMQTDSVECATQALEKYNIEKDIAAFIKKEFGKKYGPTWHCIVGQTSAHTSPTRPSTSFTSTLARSPSCFSSLDKHCSRTNNVINLYHNASLSNFL